MREAANAAWDRDWQRAIEQYQRAANLVPDDSQALAGLALSLMEAGHYQDAIAAYQRVSQLVPSDPLPYEKTAEILETLGEIAESAKKHAAVAEIYFARKDVERAVPHWQQAVYLDPDLPQPHMRLAVIYERDKATVQQAIYEYLELARLLQSYGQPQKAEQALQRARHLDPLNADIRNALDDLRRNKPLQRPADAPLASSRAVEAAEAEFLPPGEAVEAETEHLRSPVDEAARHAMGLLADMIWAGQVPTAAQGPLMQAMDLHQLGDAAGAIQAYSRAFSAGLDTPALRLNLGLLYQHTHSNRDAINLLSQVSGDPDYALAANLGIGLAYLDEDDAHRAAAHLVRALQAADRAVNLHFDAGGYERLLGSLSEQSRDHLAEMCRALVLALNDQNWRKRLTDALSGYAAQGNESYVSDLMELLIEGGRPEIAQIMERVEMFMTRNLLRLAMDEAHYALERSPDYLPAHRQLAAILIREGRTQEAASKLNLVANAYLLRGNADKAADLFTEVIQLWPADLAARERVIDMLKSQGRVNDVLRQYVEMGDLFYRLRAEPDRAIAIYNEALEYGEKHNADPGPQVALLKALADIESQRLNWREALGYYDRIMALAPDDQESALALVDLNFQLGQPERAIRTLDAYMRYCVTSGHTERIVTTLEQQVRRHPDQPALRQRLSDVYRQQKRIPEAIAQLDALGEMYLEAGSKADAIEVIRRIVAMNPPDVQSYRQLLEQLERPA